MLRETTRKNSPIWRLDFPQISFAIGPSSPGVEALASSLVYTPRQRDTSKLFTEHVGFGGNNINYSADKTPRRNTIRRRASPAGIVRTLSIPAINICTGLCRRTRRGERGRRMARLVADAYLSSSSSSSSETHLFTLVSFAHSQASLMPVHEASPPPRHPFSVSNLPVARNKPPLPWLLPCRIFPWVSTVAFLSHCIAPCHRDDDHNDQPPPRQQGRRRRQQPRGQFVCFRFHPFVATHHLFGGSVGAKVVRFIVPPISKGFYSFHSSAVPDKLYVALVHTARERLAIFFRTVARLCPLIMDTDFPREND